MTFDIHWVVVLGCIVGTVILLIVILKIKPDLICGNLSCSSSCPTPPACPECPGCPPPPTVVAPQMGLVSGNNGSVTCDQYCNGHWGKESLPSDWKGASALIAAGIGNTNPSAPSQGSCLCIRDDSRPFSP